MVKLFINGETYHTVESSYRNGSYLRKKPEKTHPRQEMTRENFAHLAISARRLGLNQRDIMDVVKGKTPEELHNLIFGTDLKPPQPTRKDLLDMRNKMIMEFIDSI